MNLRIQLIHISRVVSGTCLFLVINTLRHEFFHRNISTCLGNGNTAIHGLARRMEGRPKPMSIEYCIIDFVTDSNSRAYLKRKCHIRTV